MEGLWSKPYAFYTSLLVTHCEDFLSIYVSLHAHMYRDFLIPKEHNKLNLWTY